MFLSREDIIRMAREAGGVVPNPNFQPYFWKMHISDLERFAALIAAAERLAVKKDIEEEMTDELEDEAYHLCMQLIAKILKRGQA